MKTPTTRASGLETGISNMLTAGVVFSLLLEVAGMLVLFLTTGHLSISAEASAYLQEHNFFTFLYDLAAGTVADGAALRLITAGIVVLILTPYVRLLASVGYFAWEKDYKFTIITAFVLAVVTVSLALH